MDEAPTDMVEVDPRIAAHQVARLEISAAAGLEQMVKTSGWLVASLLVVNGGGAVATLQIVDKLANPKWPLWAFGAGLLLAMLSAVLIQAIQTWIAKPTEDLIFAWRLIEIHGHYSLEGMNELTAPVNRIGRLAWVPPAIGWASAAAFVVGGTLLTQSIPSRPTKVTTAVPANSGVINRP